MASPGGREPFLANAAVGLCAECTHARPVTSGKGSTFWLCGRSAEDPGFPRYPRLPMLGCPGFVRRAG